MFSGVEILTFDPTEVLAILAGILVVVQFIKKGIEWIEGQVNENTLIGRILKKIAHGWGPKVLAALASAVSLLLTRLPELQQIASDGVLDVGELSIILSWLGITVGSTWLYVAVRKFGFTKK